MGREAREWEDVEAGRCKHLLLPCPFLSSTLSLSVCVLDAPSHFEASSPFAAILVPRGQELEWVFCVPNGLWDLLFSASVSRLVVLHRSAHQRGGGGLFQANLGGESVTGTSQSYHICVDDVDVATHNRNEKDRASGISQSYPLRTDRVNVNEDGDDVSFKKSMTPLLHSLFPWSICPCGPAPDPYITYEDHVRTRVIVEIRNLEALDGGILVEDVELNCSLDNDTSIVGAESNKCRRTLRRRMRFQQMPNLIQTEMPIAIYKNGQLTSMHGLEDVKAVREKLACNHSLEKSIIESGKVGEVSEVELEVRLDHSTLVHKYLPPIVAGLVLASPCLEACTAANTRARFLTIGLGGGALPIFLHRQFGFSVLAVDTNEIVVDLARRHFGLVENEHLQVQVKDGMDVVCSIAHQACNNNSGSIEVAKDWQTACKDSAQEIPQGKSISGFEPNDARMHVIVVDVNVADARSGLLSPPPCFLSKAFLLAVRLALHEGGMLVVNVIPRTKLNLDVVVNSLRRVFSGIYQIQIEDNHVLFAFRSKIADINMSCAFALNVAHVTGEDLFDKIEEIEESIDD